jgi:hypothetical protein
MNWRTIGDTTLAAFKAKLKGTRLESEAESIFTVARPHTKLLIAQAEIESEYANSDLARNANNFLGQRPRPDDDRPTVPGPFRKFASLTDCARYWIDKLTDPDYAYADTVTLEQFVHVYAPSSDGNDEAAYVASIKRIVANLPDQNGGTPPVGKQVAMFIDQRLTSRDLGFLDGGTDVKAYITIHNNGNLGSMRYNEAEFVDGGGGTESVLYHGAIDAGGLVQIEKFDRRGRHAGNSIGNATSIAFEMCEGSEPWDQTEENMAQGLAGIVLGDPRLDYGRLSPENFSLDRVVEHRDWGRTVGKNGELANPNCPRRVIATDGAIDNRIIPRARQIVKAALEGTDPTPIPNPTNWVKPILTWMGDDIEKGVPSDHKWKTTIKGESVTVQIYGAEREYEVLKSTWRYQRPESGGPKVGPRLQVRESFTGSYICTVGKTRWVVTRWGSWILASYLTPRVSVRAA